MEHESKSEHNVQANVVMLPTYSIYLIAFTICIMLVAVIGLAITLYLLIKNKQSVNFNINDRHYLRRQESSGTTTVYPINHDHNKNSGSTLTVNSGIVEINKISEPETPTRIEDSKIVFAKRPLKSIVPVMPRGQMDAICKEVLRKVQKTDSASFRDLNELLNGKSEEKYEVKYKVLNELATEKKIEGSVEEIKTDSQHETELNNETKTSPEIKYDLQYENKQNTTTEPNTQINNESNNNAEKETKNDTQNENIYENNCGQSKNMTIKVDKECISAENSDSDTKYDIVPNPIRFRHSGPEAEIFDRDSIPLYDTLPRRSYNGVSQTVVQLDQDSQYFLPLSTEKTDSCYINAKRHSYTLT